MGKRKSINSKMEEQIKKEEQVALVVPEADFEQNQINQIEQLKSFIETQRMEVEVEEKKRKLDSIPEPRIPTSFDLEELFHHAFTEWNWSFGWQLIQGDVTSAQMSHKLGAGMRDGFKLAYIWRSLWVFNKTWGENSLFQFIKKGSDEVAEITSLDELTPSSYPIQLTDAGRKLQADAKEFWSRDKGKRGLNGQKKERKKTKAVRISY